MKEYANFDPFAPADESTQPPAPQSANGWAIASLIFGILSLVICTCCCGGTGWIPLVFGAVAIVLAIVSRKGQKMSGVAIGGLVCGIIGAVLAIALLVMSFIFLDASFLEQMLIDMGVEIPAEFYEYMY